jgi:hypothetical protein
MNEYSGAIYTKVIRAVNTIHNAYRIMLDNLGPELAMHDDLAGFISISIAISSFSASKSSFCSSVTEEDINI